MLKKASMQLAMGLGARLEVDGSQVEVFSYALQILLGAGLKIIVYVIASLLLDIFWPTMLLIMAFAGFKFLGGGVHFSSYSRCLVGGFIIIMGLAEIATLPVSESTLIILLGLVCVLAIYIIARWVPAGTEKKTVKRAEDRLKQKKESSIFLLLWFVGVAFCIYYGCATYALALILGASGGLFFITPYGYWIIERLDNMLNKFVKEGK